MQSETQPALAELVDVQRTLIEISNDLDIISGSLIEDPYTLVKMQAIHSTARGLHEFVRTHPTLQTLS